MEKIKIIMGVMFVLGIFSILTNVSSVNAERSWDNKAEQEDVVWEQEIELWKQAVEKWSRKRDNLHEQYYGDKYDNRAKYCDDLGCWEENMFDLNFTSKNGLVHEMEKAGNDVGNEFTFEDGSVWDCVNSGQSLTFSSLEGEFWDSGNYGQSIEYKNATGDYWESSNTGQSIEFKGADGTRWESSNYGQVVEYIDKDGNTWSGSDSDNINDMR